MQTLTAKITNIIAENANVRIFILYSDGSTDSFLVSSNTNVDDINNKAKQLLQVRNDAINSANELSQTIIGSIIE